IKGGRLLLHPAQGSTPFLAMKFTLLILALATALFALPTKRQAQNSYGDEPQTPAPAAYNQAVSAAPEYASTAVVQEPATASAAVESSGYRHKRQAQNSYGDEPQTPAPAAYNQAVSAAPEYAPAAVAQEPVTASAAVESSGYRHKRQAQNSYGDEPQTPAPATYNQAVSAAPEYAPTEVAQEAATASAAVESSGYRHRRQTQNSYGDEPQTPGPATYNQAVSAAPEYSAAQVSQEVVTAAAAVESSGYRH
ncbi:hypothetical protein PMAYCL1PPCAC_17657, partial [Pristionchus mayeri]